MKRLKIVAEKSRIFGDPRLQFPPDSSTTRHFRLVSRRRAVSALLDINESELRVGLRVVRSLQGQVVGQVFLSDSLENGAGYCSQFAQPAELERLLRFVTDSNGSFLSEILAPYHADPDKCQTSCPDCLRDYTNLAWHCILDWRLAVDMARLALDSNAQVDFTVPYWRQLLTAVTIPYFNALGSNAASFGGLPTACSGTRGEIIVHPLWAANHPIILLARAEAIAAGITQFQPLKTLFELVRRPY